MQQSSATASFPIADADALLALRQASLSQDVQGLQQLGSSIIQIGSLHAPLAGLALRGLRGDLNPDFSTAVLDLAKQLPQWNVLRATEPAQAPYTLPPGQDLGWFSVQNWDSILSLLVKGQTPALLLAEQTTPNDGQIRFVRSEHTLLSASILLGYTQMRDFLLMAATNIDAEDSDSHTALWSACEVNDESTAQFLLQRGARPMETFANADGTPLLYDALILSGPGIIDLLLEKGLPEKPFKCDEGYSTMATILGRRLWFLRGSDGIDRVLGSLLRAGMPATDERIRRACRCFGTLLQVLMQRRASEAGAWEVARCIQLLAQYGAPLDQMGSLGDETATDLGFSVPPPAPAKEEEGDEAEGQVSAPFLATPLALCLLARRVWLDSEDEETGDSVQDVEEVGDAVESLSRYRQVSAGLTASLLLECCRALLAAGADPEVECSPITGSAIQLANTLQDEEALELLREEVKSGSYTMLSELPAEDEQMGPPSREWLNDLNLQRQTMRHAYRMS